MQVGGIRGMASSLQNLARDPNQATDNELDAKMRAASKAAAEKIVPHAKAAVPVISGALKRSIRADTPTRRYARIKAGTAARTPYALAVHRGTYRPGSKVRTKATKYLSSVIPKVWPQIVDEYVKAMNEIAKEFQKRHGVDRIQRARR